MIGSEGQYLFKFSIGDKENFISNTSLEYFTVIEEAGNLLPTWEITFTTLDYEVLSVFNSGNDFEISYGVTLDSLQDSKLLISTKKIGHIGNNKYQIIANGIYSQLPYISKPNKFISDKKSGIEVIKDIIGNYFVPDFNIDKSEDSQYWIQPNITDKAFVDNLWLHSYKKDSFIGTSIGLDGKFRVRDIKKAAEEDPVFNFTPIIEKDNDIPYMGDYVLLSEAGFIDCWVGYGKEKMISNLEESTYEFVNESYKPFLALTPNISLRAEVEKKAAIEGIHNENTHPKYWNAALRNVTGLALFSRESNILSFEGRLLDIHPFDVVLFKDVEINNTGQSSEYFSGLYLVGKVSISISNKSITTTLQLFRESFNAVKGDFR